MRTYYVRTYIESGQIYMVSRGAMEFASSLETEAKRAYDKEVAALGEYFYLREELDHEPIQAEERMARYCILLAVDSDNEDGEYVLEASELYYE